MAYKFNLHHGQLADAITFVAGLRLLLLRGRLAARGPLVILRQDTRLAFLCFYPLFSRCRPLLGQTFLFANITENIAF